MTDLFFSIRKSSLFKESPAYIMRYVSTLLPAVDAKKALFSSKAFVFDIEIKKSASISKKRSSIGLMQGMSISMYTPPYLCKTENLRRSALSPGLRDLSIINYLFCFSKNSG